MANAHGSATSWEQRAWIPHPAGAAEPGLGRWKTPSAPGQERPTRPTGRYSFQYPDRRRHRHRSRRSGEPSMIDLGSAVHGGGLRVGRGALKRRHPRGGPVLAACFGRGASPCPRVCRQVGVPGPPRRVAGGPPAGVRAGDECGGPRRGTDRAHGAMRRDPRAHRRHRRWPATTGHSGEGSRSRRAGRARAMDAGDPRRRVGYPRRRADTKTIWFAMAQRSPDLTEPLGWSTRLAGMNCRTAASPRR